MSGQSVEATASSPEDRFAQNVVAEAVTIVLILLLGLASSILIVRGLPRTPVYEFYIFVLVFSWVNILIPLGIMGMDVMLRRHIPEVLSCRSVLLSRVLGVALVIVILVSTGIVLVVNILVWWFPPNSLVPSYAVPFLFLALWTVPLTAVSSVFQGGFRGMQEMRYCTFAMGLYHCAYFVGLVLLFVSGTMSLLLVIFANFAASGLTIAYEAGVLQSLYKRYKGTRMEEAVEVSVRPMLSTAIQALVLAVLGAVFLYFPLLIANMYRTSDLVLAGLGLALSVGVWIQQGLAAPFGVLMPRTAGDVAQKTWSTIRRYMNRAWKLGVLLSGFVAVVAIFYAGPVLVVLFAEEGFIALPFFILFSGSLLVYPISVMMSDTLIGVGGIRSVVVTNAVWTAVVVFILWLFAPFGHEVLVALIWVVGIPFVFVFVLLYQRHAETKLVFDFIPKAVVMLLIVTLLAFGVLLGGSTLITLWGLMGFALLMFQIGLILTLIPLAIIYLWLLTRSRVLEPGDNLALLRMSQVLEPISRPVSWLVERMMGPRNEPNTTPD